MVHGPNGCTSRRVSNWWAGHSDARLNGEAPAAVRLAEQAPAQSDDGLPCNLRKDDRRRVKAFADCSATVERPTKRAVRAGVAVRHTAGLKSCNLRPWMDTKVSSTPLAVSRTPHPGTAARYPEFAQPPAQHAGSTFLLGPRQTRVTKGVASLLPASSRSIEAAGNFTARAHRLYNFTSSAPSHCAGPASPAYI